MLAQAHTDDDLLHWAVGLDPIPSLADIKSRVGEVIAHARHKIPRSLQTNGVDVRLEGVSEAYKISSGKVLIFAEFFNNKQYLQAGRMSVFFKHVLSGLSSSGLDTSIVILHGGRATAAISSSADPYTVFFQKDDFDPDRPNVVPSLRGARATSFEQLECSLDAITRETVDLDAEPRPLSPDRAFTTGGATPRSHGEGVMARSPSEGETMTDHMTRTSETAERVLYLASEEFEARLTDAMRRAVEAAIARHHEAGFPAHGEENGSIVEYRGQQQ